MHSMTAPLLAGVSVRNGYDVNSLAVPRRAKEAIGAIALLRNEGTDHHMTVNVEYNQLDPLLRATTHPEGDVNDDTGFSPFPGVAKTLKSETLDPRWCCTLHGMLQTCMH